MFLYDLLMPLHGLSLYGDIWPTNHMLLYDSDYTDSNEIAYCAILTPIHETRLGKNMPKQKISDKQLYVLRTISYNKKSYEKVWWSKNILLMLLQYSSLTDTYDSIISVSETIIYSNTHLHLKLLIH